MAVICGGGRDWGNLSGEMVGVISEYVDAAEGIRMRAVCAGWNRALSTSGGFHRPKVPPMPWLLVDDRRLKDDGDFKILDIFSGKLHTTIEKPSPAAGNPYQMEVRCGRWMSTFPSNLDDQTLVWYPTVTGQAAHHHHHHVQRFPSVLRVPGHPLPPGVDFRWRFVRYIKTSSSLAILCHYPNNLSVAWPGDAEWTPVGDGWGGRHDQTYYDAVSHGGCVYTLWPSGRVECWDISTRTPPFRLSRTSHVDIAGEDLNLLAASDTRLMVLQSSVFMDTITIEDSSNKVFELDFQTNTWTQLRSLGGGAIFFDYLHGAVFVEGRNLPDNRFRDRILLTALHVSQIHDPRCSPPYMTYQEWKDQEFNQGRAILLEHDGGDYIPDDEEYYDESLMLSYDVALGKFDPHYYTWPIERAWYSYGWFMPALP